MEALGGGNGWLWGWNWEPRRRKPHHHRSKKGPISSDSFGGSFSGYQFPFKQAVTAGSLALTGDTIAQLTQRRRNVKASAADDHNDNHHGQYQDFKWNFLSEHDWLRAIRMASYGVLLYGPGSYAWYQYLDHCLPQPTVKNLMLKVLLNQIVLGPSVIAVVFAWNNLWQGKLSQLPEKYRKDALPTLLNGFRFWIPVSVLNFWVVPLQARVAFMSMGSIFWNFCLSSTMSK